jgi:hypothetical protein
MRKIIAMLIVFMVIGIGILSGCTTPNEAKDTDGDGYQDNIDVFPNDATQWADKDYDGYGDNPNGTNPDAFPDNIEEWKDSDSDGIGDNSDVYPYDFNNGVEGFEWFQTGNTLPITQLQTKQSKELADNRIGGVAETRHIGDWVAGTGLKWMRVILDAYGRWQNIDWNTEEYTIDSEEERIVDDLVNNDIKIMYVLDVWNQENRTVFYKTEEDIQQYLHYVEFVVHHFKGRIEYYEILNEPNLDFSSPSGMPIPSYINLIKRTIPIIRSEDPEAKIVVGAIPDTRFDDARDYIWNLLKSEVIPLVDGFSWHGMYGAAPSDDPRGIRQSGSGQMINYWENYVSLVNEIKNVASSHGYKGEYFVEEMLWRTPLDPHETEPFGFSDTTAAKYYARAIIIHLGLNVTTGLAVVQYDRRPQSYSVIRNLCNIMAGANTISVPTEIQSEATNIKSYSFSLPDNNTLIALWTDGAAVENDTGVNTTIIINGVESSKVIAIDVIKGYEQQLLSINDDGNLKISNLLVRDYPLIIHIKK